MITLEDRNYVLEELLAVLSRIDARLTLSGALPTACMSSIEYHQLPMGYAMRSLEVCIQDRWNNAPTYLYRLLGILPDKPRTVEIRKQIQVAPILPDPMAARVLITEVPFLARTEFRKKMKVLRQDPPVRPILIVKGGEKSGKSYSADYIEHLHMNGLGFEFSSITFPKGSGGTYSPSQLAEDILTKMGVPIYSTNKGLFSNDTNNERWIYQLAQRVIAEGSHTGKKHLIILDAFKGTELLEDTAKFITSLGLAILTASVHMANFRLILLDFDGPLLVNQSKVDGEVIATVGVTDVADCVMEIFSRFQTPKEAYQIQPFVDRIMANLPTDEKRLGEINLRLTDLIKQIKEA